MHANGSGGRAELFIYLALPPFEFPGAGVGVRIFCGSLPSAAVLLVCMSAGREGKRAKLVIVFALPPFEFSRTGSGG